MSNGCDKIKIKKNFYKMSKRAALNKASKDATQKRLKPLTPTPVVESVAGKAAWEPPVLEEDDFAHEEEDEEENADENEMNSLLAAEAAAEAHGANGLLAESAESMELDHNYLSQRYLVKGSIYNPEKYERPPPCGGGSGSAPSEFMHTDTTYGIVDNQLEVRLWAITQQGHSCLVRVRGFTPYFYVDVNTKYEADDLRMRLEGYLQTKYNGNKRATTPGYLEKFVVDIEMVHGRSLCGYHKGAELRPMYKFYMARPSHVATARNCFEYVNQAVCSRKYATYEGNVPYELRYMIDAKINGCEWLRLGFALPAGGGGDISSLLATKCISSVQYEYLIHHKDNLISAIPSAQKGDLAPMRFLSYDIEVLRKKRGFPTAKEDPCIMIAAALQVTGVGIVHQVIFCLAPAGGGGESSFNPLENTSVYAYNTEAEMLLAFSQYVQACDPEALTGWNISNFDLPYLAERANQLRIFNEWMSFSRINDKPVWIRQKTFQSKAYGAKTSNEMMCEGRFDYDGLTFMLRGQMEKYRSYKLNYISKKVLNDQKLDVDYSQIPTLYEGTDEDRTRLAHYCTIDALLPLRLLDKLMAVINGIEQARVTGVPVKWLLERGQGIKTQSNLIRFKQPCEFVPSRSLKANTEVTGGGYVKEPKRGFYRVPLASLDFASLYPSIMIAFNICFSTKVELSWARANLKEGDYWIPYPAIDKKTPEMLAEEKEQADLERAAGIKRKKKNKKDREREALEAQYAGVEPSFCFVKRHIRQGVLPLLLETLLEARRNVKNMMKSDQAKQDKLYYSVLDGRQLALKVVCNSVYGFLKGKDHFFMICVCA
jgi:DNA polymerase delta subunit 1